MYKHLMNKRKEVIIKMRKKYKINIDGTDVPDPLDSFSKMNQ